MEKNNPYDDGVDKKGKEITGNLTDEELKELISIREITYLERTFEQNLRENELKLKLL
jgi:hypothetical protein